MPRDEYRLIRPRYLTFPRQKKKDTLHFNTAELCAAQICSAFPALSTRIDESKSVNTGAESLNRSFLVFT